VSVVDDKQYLCFVICRVARSFARHVAKHWRKVARFLSFMRNPMEASGSKSCPKYRKRGANAKFYVEWLPIKKSPNCTIYQPWSYEQLQVSLTFIAAAHVQGAAWKSNILALQSSHRYLIEYARWCIKG